MIKFEKILDYIDSDLGSFDLTTTLQADSVDISKEAILKIYTRENLIFSGANFIKQIAKNLDCEIVFLAKDADKFKPKDEICIIKGSYANIHKAWKVSQILLEYSCKISTYTSEMIDLIKQSNPNCTLATTRKTIPFAKEMCINAVVAGGGYIHRLGLYDSVLFFKNHIKIYKNFDEFCANIPKFKTKMPEKKIMVECESIDEFKKILNFSPNVIQCDKFSITQLQECISAKNKTNPDIVVTIAGGVNLKNCAEFAKTGVDCIITSAPYTQGVVDLGSSIEIS